MFMQTVLKKSQKKEKIHIYIFIIDYDTTYTTQSKLIIKEDVKNLIILTIIRGSLCIYLRTTIILILYVSIRWGPHPLTLH